MSRASELLQCKLGPGDSQVLVRAETIIRDLEYRLAAAEHAESQATENLSLLQDSISELHTELARKDARIAELERWRDEADVLPSGISCVGPRHRRPPFPGGVMSRASELRVFVWASDDQRASYGDYWGPGRELCPFQAVVDEDDAKSIIRDLESELADAVNYAQFMDRAAEVLRRARDEAFEHADTAREERDSAIARAKKAEQNLQSSREAIGIQVSLANRAYELLDAERRAHRKTRRERDKARREILELMGRTPPLETMAMAREAADKEWGTGTGASLFPEDES